MADTAARVVALIEQIEMSNMGDEDLDIQISELLRPDDVARGETVSVVRFTRSVDAALTLVPSGWFWTMRRFPNHPWSVQFVVTLYSPHGAVEQEYKAFAITPPLAICTACLRAFSGDQTDD